MVCVHSLHLITLAGDEVHADLPWLNPSTRHHALAGLRIASIAGFYESGAFSICPE